MPAKVAANSKAPLPGKYRAFIVPSPTAASSVASGPLCIVFAPRRGYRVACRDGLCKRLRPGRHGVPGGKASFQRGKVDGLDQMRIEPRRLRALDILGLTIAGQGDEPNVTTARADPFRHLVPVHVGKTNIQEHDVGTEGGDSVQRGRCAIHRLRLMAVELQERCQRSGRVYVVIDHEYPFGYHGTGRGFLPALPGHSDGWQTNLKG